MRLSDLVTRSGSEKNDLRQLQLSEDSLKQLSHHLESNQFSQMILFLELEIKKDWGKAKTLDERENLHHELKALKRLDRKIRTLARKIQ